MRWIPIVLILLLAAPAEAAGWDFVLEWFKGATQPQTPPVVPPVIIPPPPPVILKPVPRPPIKKPKKPIVKPTVQISAGQCAQIRQGINWIGRDGVIAAAKQRGYSDFQIREAIRVCRL
jgi:hypothetical protein